MNTESNEGPASTTTDAVGKKRGPRTDSLAGIRRLMGRVVRELYAWQPAEGMRPEIRISRARCIGYLLAEMSAVQAKSEIEDRLTRLEDLVRGAQH